MERSQGVTRRKIDGCVAMVMAADSRAYGHAVLKQDKPKEPPWMSVLCQQLDVDARVFEKSREGRAKPRLVLSHAPLFAFCLLRSPWASVAQGTAPV